MAPRNRLVLIVLAADALAAAASHVVIRWVGIETIPIRQWSLGASNSAPPLVAMGSSLTFFGLAFDQISDALGTRVICRSAASASPCELEDLVPRDVEPRLTIIGVSIFDLNEQVLSDFRADLVPATRSASDLWQSGSDWAFVKKIMGQYPLHYARWFFPTAGRSTAVMAGLRDKAGRWLNTLAGRPAPQVLTADPHYQTRRPGSLDDWDSSRLLSNLAALRVESQSSRLPVRLVL